MECGLRFQSSQNFHTADENRDRYRDLRIVLNQRIMFAWGQRTDVTFEFIRVNNPSTPNPEKCASFTRENPMRETVSQLIHFYLILKLCLVFEPDCKLRTV